MAAYTTIDDPSAYFKCQLYTGTGSSHAVTFNDTDTDMQPDLVITKNREASRAPVLFDSIRGVQKRFVTSTNDTSGTDANMLTAFGSDGFTVGSSNECNESSDGIVAWCWKAGTTSGISGSPSITPDSYSFNATSGFSMIKYDGNGTAGATLPHGLGAAPEFIIIKSTDASESWAVGHDSMTWNYYMYLNTTAAAADDVKYFNDTSPTSSLFTIGNDGSTNDASNTYIAYVFKPVQGYSKFGTYEGNGHGAIAFGGTFVYTGFRPAFVMTKSIDSTSDWQIFDNKREGYNVDNDGLVWNDTDAEVTTDYIDLLANGFKLRIATDPNVAETYVYAAFAEAPFVNSEGVPCNAR